LTLSVGENAVGDLSERNSHFENVGHHILIGAPIFIPLVFVSEDSPSATFPMWFRRVATQQFATVGIPHLRSSAHHHIVT
jgi:hypothetical protein